MIVGTLTGIEAEFLSRKTGNWGMNLEINNLKGNDVIAEIWVSPRCRHGINSTLALAKDMGKQVIICVDDNYNKMFLKYFYIDDDTEFDKPKKLEAEPTEVADEFKD